MQNKLSRRQKYWICQLSGWGFYSLTWYIVGHGPEYFLGKVLFAFTIFALQIGFTHLFRAIILKNKWMDLPIKNILQRVIISCFIISLIIETILLVSFNWSNLSEVLSLPFGYTYVRYFNRGSVNIAWSVIYFAVHYFEKYNKEKIEKLWYEMMLKDSELQLLKSQMHPHFIFNAINSISGLINENPQKAQFALSQLSSLLRYSLNANKKETVALEEEMQIVSDYLELESIRYEERLNVKMEISPDTLHARIPPLMVQVLCENSIKHCISKLPLGGCLHIRSETDKNNLKIEVRNSGRLVEDNKTEEGHGIRNTKQRLSLLYGSDASLSLSNGADNFVIAELKIPLEETYEYSDN